MCDSHDWYLVERVISLFYHIASHYPARSKPGEKKLGAAVLARTTNLKGWSSLKKNESVAPIGEETVLRVVGHRLSAARVQTFDHNQKSCLKREAAHRIVPEHLLEQVSIDGWRQAISLVIEQVSADQKIVLVMDEFQWTVEACPELPSVLQSFIDNGWEGGCKVCLILYGSYMGFMERKVLGEKSPLFGRRAGQIFLKPFSYLESVSNGKTDLCV
jgi:hypothetical protein